MPVTGPPRTDPGVRDSRTGLLPWVFGVEAHNGPRVKDASTGNPLLCQPLHLRPRGVVLLAATPKRPAPEFDDVSSEGFHRGIVGRDRVVVEVPLNHLPQPRPLLGDRVVPSASQLLFDCPQRGP